MKVLHGDTESGFDDRAPFSESGSTNSLYKTDGDKNPRTDSYR
jgi:hypothetical protein